MRFRRYRLDALLPVGDPVPELIKRDIKEAEDDPGTGGASFFSAGIPFCPRPHSPIDHDATIKAKDLQRDLPLQLLHSAPAGPKFSFWRGNSGVKPMHPVVAGQTEGEYLMLNGFGEGGLSGAGQTAGQVECGHWKSLIRVWQIDASPHFCVTALRSMPQIAADQMFVAMPNLGAASL